VKIRILHNFYAYETGQVFEDWPSGMCETLIQRGFIEEVKDVETAEAPAEVERAAVEYKQAKKKRA
jgi:hypothetical protein